MNTQRITVDLDRELYEQLRLAAFETRESMSDITRRALQAWFERRQEQEQQDQ